MKISYYNLILEITRRCNMNCAHCMRGEAQDIDIPFEVIDKALENVSHIGSLTLTGGEISLNPAAISYVAKQIREREIDLNSVYLVTNGKQVTTEFLVACVELFSLANDGEFNGLALSSDMFHEKIDPRNIQMLRTLAAFNDRDKNTDFKMAWLQNLGRARNLDGFARREPAYYEPEYEVYDDELCFTEANICVTVHGDILKDCNYEYAHTDHLKIGNVFDNEWIQRLIADREAA